MFANQVCFLNSSLAPPTSSTQGADRSWMLGQKAAQAIIGSRTYHCTDERLSQKWLICSGCPAGSCHGDMDCLLGLERFLGNSESEELLSSKVQTQ
jgi:hypothetical protein